MPVLVLIRAGSAMSESAHFMIRQPPVALRRGGWHILAEGSFVLAYWLLWETTLRIPYLCCPWAILWESIAPFGGMY